MSILSSALAAMAASIAYQATATGMAMRAVIPSLLVQRIHIAVGTAVADFLAAVPWIPDVVHFLTQPLP